MPRLRLVKLRSSTNHSTSEIHFKHINDGEVTIKKRLRYYKSRPYYFSSSTWLKRVSSATWLDPPQRSLQTARTTPPRIMTFHLLLLRLLGRL